MNHKTFLYLNIYKLIIAIAILTVAVLVMCSLIFCRLDNPKVEVRYVDRVITNERVVTVKEYIGSGIEWHDDFIVTGYTQQDEGCNNITSIGVNLDRSWTQHFNFVAVDPKVIPYGTTVFIKISDEILPALAVDCGGAIVGEHIDFYCKDLKEVYELMDRIGKEGVIVGWVR